MKERFVFEEWKPHIKWWERIFLFFKPKYTHTSEGYEFTYKKMLGKIYLVDEKFQTAIVGKMVRIAEARNTH